jgi:hypothetical protein
MGTIRHGMARAQLALFADPRSLISTVLCQAAVRLARARVDIEVVAIVDAAQTALPWGVPASKLAADLAKRLFDAAHPLVLRRPLLTRVPALARRLQVPLLVPPERDVNDPGFVASVRADLGADAGLNLFGTQIFAPELLGALPGGVVNYHNGLLPAYRGTHATAWSVYRGEPTTGLTFHRMTDEIDAGPILVQDAILVRSNASVRELEWEKTVRAAALLPPVLDAIVAGDPGRSQAGEPSYFGRKDHRAITWIEKPGSLTFGELDRRLHAFGNLRMLLGGEIYRATRLRRVGPRGPRRAHLSFTTADGITGEADRLLFLPPELHRIAGALRP